MRSLFLLSLFLLLFITPKVTIAGPPFTTDDPEPVTFLHWEVYVAFQNFWTVGQESNGTLPQIEINFGAAPGLQLHAIVPIAWTISNGGPFHYGPGDIELGFKYRFVNEGDWMPQIGVFPLLELPVGNARLDLGSGHVEAFFPVWIQKSFGEFTSYAGGGYWISNPSSAGSWFGVGKRRKRRHAPTSVGSSAVAQRYKPWPCRLDSAFILWEASLDAEVA